MQEDPSKTCINYPNDKFESYKACEDDFLTKSLPPGFVPIWATDNLSLVTREVYNPNISGFVDLFDGSKMSTCPLPCSTISVESRQRKGKESTHRNFSKLNLSFNDYVTVTSHNFIQFKFPNLLSEIGGGLGLWLGLGVLQAFELLVCWCSPCVKRWLNAKQETENKT